MRLVYKYNFLGVELLIIKDIICLDTGFYMRNLSVIPVSYWDSEKGNKNQFLGERNAKEICEYTYVAIPLMQIFQAQE